MILYIQLLDQITEYMLRYLLMGGAHISWWDAANVTFFFFIYFTTLLQLRPFLITVLLLALIQLFQCPIIKIRAYIDGGTWFCNQDRPVGGTHMDEILVLRTELRNLCLCIVLLHLSISSLLTIHFVRYWLRGWDWSMWRRFYGVVIQSRRWDQWSRSPICSVLLLQTLGPQYSP